MTSRDRILAAIRQNKPEATPLPEMPRFDRGIAEPVAAFTAQAEASGIRVIQGADHRIADLIATQHPDAQRIASTLDGVPSAIDWSTLDDPHTLADLDVLVCPATLAVAENAALWVTETQMGHRAAPYITQHLILVVEQAQIVTTMHDAYAQLTIGADAFGCFIAGPSKTADIEQSLVIGAHGPRSLTVVLT
ncbi:MAG: LUD domain-containing protein [Rhodothermales bacterium]